MMLRCGLSVLLLAGVVAARSPFLHPQSHDESLEGIWLRHAGPVAGDFNMAKFAQRWERDMKRARGGRFEGLECDTCKLFMYALDDLIRSEATNDVINAAAVAVCIYMEIEDERVCGMSVKEWGPTVEFLLEYDLFSVEDVCFDLVGPDCTQPKIHAANWTLEFPSTPRPAYTPLEPPPAGTPTGRVLFLSDIHLDVYYEEGSNSVCGEPLCCRVADGKAKHDQPKAWKFGSLYECDTPVVSLKYVLEELSQQQFDLVVFTGDVPPHDVYNQTQESQIRIISYVNELMYTHFPDTPVLNAIGNHEANPVNQFIPPFSDRHSSPNPMQWLYQVLADQWTHWLPESTLSTIARGAFWSWEALPGLQVISINSGYGQHEDWYMRANNSDAAGMLQWMIGELQAVEDSGKRAWIISHHPEMGLGHYNEQFYKVLQRYSNSISVWLNGHTHTDNTFIWYDPTYPGTPPVLIGHNCPGITTFHDENTGLNIGYHVLHVDSKRGANSTFAVVDYDAFFLNLTKAEEVGALQWELEYNAKEAYDLPDLTPASYSDLADQFLVNETLVNKYMYYKDKATVFNFCDSACAQNTVNYMKRYLPAN